MKRVRDERKVDRVELPGSVLLAGLLTSILGKARSLRSATDKAGGVLSEGSVLRSLLKGVRGRRSVLAHASTFHAFLRQVCVSHSQRLNIFICKRLKQMKALLWNGMVVVALDASGIPAPTDVFLNKGALSQTRRKLDDEGNALEYKVCFFLLSNLYTVGGAVRAYLGFEVARVGEQQASRDLLKWVSSSHQGYGPRFIDVLLADALYCNQVDLSLIGRVATRGWMVRANRSVGAVVDAERLLEDGEKAVCAIKGDRTVVRAVPLQWPEVGRRLRLLEVQRDGGVPLLFVTNLPWTLAQLATLGRERWGIENNLHKDLKHEWPWTYLPSETLRGLKAWWWLVAIAINLFYAFFNRHVQPRLAQLGRAVFGTVRAAREYLTRHIADENLPGFIEQEDYG